jgi:glycosyltransferase domain-containing protein
MAFQTMAFRAETTQSALQNWLAKMESGVGSPPACATLSLLTVVIPSYGRQDFILRQCAYWHRSGATVVIADGSAQPLAVELQHLIGEFDDICYVHSPVSMMERLRAAAALIRTPYAILLGDDEFLLFSGLRSAIMKLEAESDLVACIGQSLAFYPSRDGSHCTYGAGYPHWRYAVASDNVSDRLDEAMSDYTAATCYAVLRTPVWKKSWGQLEKWSSPYVGEMQQGLTTYIWGKLATVDEVYWMRSSENRPVTNVEFNRGLSFHEWWFSPKFGSERDQFVRILKAELKEAYPEHAGNAESIVLKAIEIFIRHLHDLKERRHPSQKLTVVALRAFAVRVLKSVLPRQWTERLKSRIFTARAIYVEGEFGMLANVLEVKDTGRFLGGNSLKDELLAMENLISGFYRARGKIEI